MGNLVGHPALKPNHGDDGQYSEDQTSSIHHPSIIRKVRRSPGSYPTFGSAARKGIEDRASSKPTPCRSHSRFPRKASFFDAPRLSEPDPGSLYTDFPEEDDQILKAIELQDGLINKLHNKNCARNATLKNAKLTMVHNMTLIILSLFFILTCAGAFVMNGPAAFGKDQRMDKLILKNQIGYHFKKVVREVSQELFISRKIDVSTLFIGVHVLKHTAIDLDRYCRNLGSGHEYNVSPKENKRLPTYSLIAHPKLASFAEAKARCEANRMQLPEVYTNLQQDNLSLFLRTNNISKCFAGLQPDFTDSTFRFISTGFPIWRTPQDVIYNSQGGTLVLPVTMDDAHTKFQYTDDNKMIARYVKSITSDQSYYKLGDNTYRNSRKDFPQIVSPIVCEAPWDGRTYDHFKADNRVAHGIEVQSITKREASASSTYPPSGGQEDHSATDSLKEYCESIKDQASELHTEMNKKLRNLLSLVDISVKVDSDADPNRLKRNSSLDMTLSFNNTLSDIHRPKRFAFLTKFIFQSGVKVIWNLFKFVQMMRLENKIKKLETSISSTQQQAKANFDAIQNMSLVVSSNSMAIDQLKVTTADLTRRMDNLEYKVDSLVYKVDTISNILDDMTKLSLVANLVDRIRQSLYDGYDVLKDIIHCSLLGQTSPLLLPSDQLELVQNEVRKKSTGILDTDFMKMMSIVVSDPKDPHLLLVVINIAALSRKEGELVKLVSIPQFEKGLAFSPALDYNSIIVDQLERKYFILSDQEEYDCLFNRCYISDVERAIDLRTCGIPQLFEQQMDACVYSEVPSSGVFVKPMYPDGVLFAFRGKVITQLFCRDNTDVGPIRELSGTGIMQVPNGCTMSLTDDRGISTKVKGQPLSRSIEAGDLTLITHGPLNAIHSYVDKNGSNKLVTPDKLITSHLFPVVQQVKDVDAQVKSHTHYMWILLSLFIIACVIILIIIMAMYRSRRRFFVKIYDLRDRFKNLIQQMDLLRDVRERFQQTVPSAPFVPAPARMVYSPRLKKFVFRHRLDNGDIASYHSMEDVMEGVALRNMDNDSISSQGTARTVARNYYPLSLPTFQNQDEIEQESKEVEEMSVKFSSEFPTRRNDNMFPPP